MGSIAAQGIRRVAVIGGGPLGVATTKYLEAERHFEQIDVYEQQENVQGTWSHSPPSAHERTEAPQSDPHKPLPRPEWRTLATGASYPSFTTPMYDNLDTNLPKQLMMFSDKAFPDNAPLFPSREIVSNYIEEYAEGVRDRIKFATQVLDVELISSGRDIWRLTSQNLQSGLKSTADYDGIAVCSGHYTVPYLPNRTGLEQWTQSFPGSVIHSKFYRSPDAFSGKKVLVVGNAASGTDIANQISGFSKLPLLVSQRSESFLATPGKATDEKKLVLPEIRKFIDASVANRAIEFVNGHVEYDIDLVLFATGYFYSFPFLRNSQLGLIEDGMRMEKLYLHLIHRDHPSIAFFGMPIRIVPFPLGEVQAAVMARLWSGRLTLPSREEMLEWEAGVIAELGNGRRFHQLEFPNDYKYQRKLFHWLAQCGEDHGKMPKKWGDHEYWMRKHVPTMKRAFADQGASRTDITDFAQLGFSFEEWRRENGDSQEEQKEYSSIR